MKRCVMLGLLAMAASVMLAGCNTVAGVGKDVQKVGEKVEDASGK